MGFFMHKSLGASAYFHRFIQYMFFLFYIVVGVRFYQYFSWATERTPVYTPRPVAVEAFLPIGAFASAKRLLLTGDFDLVHPAALVIFLMAVTTSFLFRKAFCGYMCPIGCACSVLERLGKRCKISYTPNRWLSYVLEAPKYILLFAFVWLIWWGMDVNAIQAFTQTPYYQVADSRMLLLFMQPSVVFLAVIVIILVGNIIIPSFWCRTFCPYGALLGLISLASPLGINRDSSSCIGCNKCTKACPSRILVHTKKRVSVPECIGCLECISACPIKNCLTIKAGYTKKTPPIPFWVIGAGAFTVLLLFFVWAVDTGHWQIKIDPMYIKGLHEKIVFLAH